MKRRRDTRREYGSIEVVPDLPLLVDASSGWPTALIEDQGKQSLGKLKRHQQMYRGHGIHVGFVINIGAANFNLNRFTRALGKWATQNEMLFDLHFMQSGRPLSGPVTTMIENGAQAIVAVGGDGTVSAVASEMVGWDVPIGIIPAGTANGAAVALGLPLAFDRALDLLVDGSGKRALDVIKVGERVYTISVSVGVSSQSLQNLTARSKERLGVMGYYLSGLKEASLANSKRFSVELDGEQLDDEFLEIAILNMGILGLPDIFLGGEILPDDGLLRMFAVKQASLKGTVWQLLRGRSRVNSRVHLRDIKRIKIDGDAEAVVQADGDVIGTLPVSAEILPAAIQVLVPGAL